MNGTHLAQDIRWITLGERYPDAETLICDLIKIPWFRNMVRDVVDTETLEEWVGQELDCARDYPCRQ